MTALFMGAVFYVSVKIAIFVDTYKKPFNQCL